MDSFLRIWMPLSSVHKDSFGALSWTSRVWSTRSHSVLSPSIHFLSFFISYSDILLRTHDRCREPFLLFITLNDTHTHTQRTPLDEGSARSRDLYLTTHNNHKRQTSMSPAGFGPAIPATVRPQTHELNSASIGIVSIYFRVSHFIPFFRVFKSCYWVVCFTILLSSSLVDRARFMDFGEYWCLPRVCKLAK